MPDERVEAAIKNWAPRFTSQGVDYNDFFRTTARVQKWEDWCHEWVATGDVHYDLAVKAEAKGNLLSAGEAYIGAALCYHFGKFVFQDFYDEYMSASKKSVETFAKGLKLLDPSGERVEIPFDGATMVGHLRRPPGAGRPPLVLLLPGLDSVKEEFFYWENVFLKRGLATFSLDGPGQGECGFETHIHVDRLYHSSAILLPDGRVMAVGSNPVSKVNELRIEIYRPPYLFQGPRPAIQDAPAQVAYGQEVAIRSAQAGQVEEVALIHPASTTHCLTTDQRYVGLAITRRDPDTLRVQIPPNPNLAPPGYYMLFLVSRDGVPSEARFVRLAPPT